MVQQFLSRLPRIRPRQYLFLSSIKSYLPLKLSTACLQEKSSHKKTRAYLIQNISHACWRNSLACSICHRMDINKTSGFFFLLIPANISMSDQRCFNVVDQRWNSIDPTLKMKQNPTLDFQRYTKLIQRWYNFISTLFQNGLFLSKIYIKTSRASGKYGFLNR